MKIKFLVENWCRGPYGYQINILPHLLVFGVTIYVLGLDGLT